MIQLTRRTFAAWLGSLAAAPAVFAAKPALDVVAASQVLARLNRVSAVPQGAGPRWLTVFVDPNCPYCRQLFHDLQPLIDHDGLGVRWVPVAVLAPSSRGKAAAILQAPDPLAALRATETHGLDPAIPAPKPLVAAQIRSATSAALAANAAALQAAGIYAAVPLMVFTNREGTARLELALPRDPQALQTLLASVAP